MEQLRYYWTDFHEIWYLSILGKSVEEIQVPLKSDKHNGYFTWRTIYISVICRSFLCRMWNVSDKVVDKTHVIFSNFKKSISFYEIMWKSISEPCRPQMTIWRMHIACWIPKSTSTHSEYVIPYFPAHKTRRDFFVINFRKK